MARPTRPRTTATTQTAGPEALLDDLLTDAPTLNVPRDLIHNAAQALVGPVAEVQLPSDESMRMRLVPEASVHHLDELRSDAALLMNLACLTIGGMLSWIASALTAAEVRTGMWAMGASLTSVSALLIILATRSAKRAARQRAAIFPDSTR